MYGYKNQLYTRERQRLQKIRQFCVDFFNKHTTS